MSWNVMRYISSKYIGKYGSRERSNKRLSWSYRADEEVIRGNDGVIRADEGVIRAG